MRKLLILLALAPALASAQVRASFSIDLPVMLPQLVVVQPGIQVVPDQDVEVFFADGFYWTRNDGRWYRSRSHRGGWVYADRGVPPGLQRMPPGRYRHWRPAPAPGPRAGIREERREERRDERRDEKRHEKHDDDRGHGRHD
jgi:hypothetical protein